MSMLEKSDVKWLIEEYIVDDDPRLKQEVERQGYEVKILPHTYKLDMYKNHHNVIDYFLSLFPEESIVAYAGSLQTARQLNFTVNYYKHWISMNKEQFDKLYCSKYLRYIEPKFQLNEHHLYLPTYDLFRLKRDKNVFIRPDDPYKTFVGQILAPELSISEFRTKNDLVGSDGTDFVLASDVQDGILSEIRCFCTEDDVISASYYKQRMLNELQIQYESCMSDELVIYFVKNNILPELKPLINELGMIVVDIATVRDSYNFVFKVIELGHPMTCSLYEANFEKYVDTMAGVLYDKYIKEQITNA